MIIAWTAASYTFFLLNFFIKHLPGDIYFNSIIAGLSCVGLLIEGQLQSKLDIKGG